MTLIEWIEEMGDRAAGDALGLSARTMRSWRCGSREPSPREARKVVAVTHGLVGFDAIYGPDGPAARRKDESVA